jgi:hypothetical protein
MVDMQTLGYASVYSFSPAFVREITEKEETLETEDSAIYQFDRTETRLLGILASLVYMLLIGTIVSFIVKAFK